MDVGQSCKRKSLLDIFYILVFEPCEFFFLIKFGKYTTETKDQLRGSCESIEITDHLRKGVDLEI